jgi:hypothetical protein
MDNNRLNVVVIVLLLGVIILVVLAPLRREIESPTTALAQSGCPTTPVVTINSPQTPSDVCIPAGFGGNPIQYFDDYSWRTFISMVWPANKRGVPDATRKVGDVSSPLVFETLKNDWEVFQPAGGAPSAWDDFSGTNPCGASVGFDDMVLASFTKFGNLGEAGGSAQNPLVHALPSQNGKWVRYLTAFNHNEYTQIVDGKLYILSTLKAASPLTFQSGALDVKSAWMDMSGVSDAQKTRYYTRPALVIDPTNAPGSACVSITVGLVGLHIVQKTPSRPQWIWSTFEQVDNVPSASVASGTFAFNDGKGTPSPLRTGKDPNGGFPPNDWANPKVYNVERLVPIDSVGSNSPTTSTQTTNGKYRGALAGTVWQFYELVMTQWPLQLNPPNPIPPAQDGSIANTFPGTGASSSFSNTTLETWDQGSVILGCMSCHTKTKKDTDFLWSLEINAFDASKPHMSLMTLRINHQNRSPRSEPERQLIGLLKKASKQRSP